MPANTPVRSWTAAALIAFAVTACSTTLPDSSSRSALPIGALDLSGSCPETVMIQTDWNPQAEHGHLFELLGDDYTIDAATKAVRGPLMSRGEFTGVDVEIRAGGPAIGYQSVASQMYTDPDILLGYVNTDDAIRLAADMPTRAVFAPLEISPLMIMWGADSYPGVTDIAGLIDQAAVIRYFDGKAYMAYLISTGTVPEGQTDGSYDGMPATFVASQGLDAQQGFVSSEPYIYEHEVPSWRGPIAYQMVSELGYRPYQTALAIRSDELEAQRTCLTSLVPVLQQAEIDFVNDPSPSISRIIAAVDTYNTGWVYSEEGVASYAVDTMLRLGIIGNGTNTTVGDVDDARVQDFLDRLAPVLEQLGDFSAANVTPTDLYTNDFIDTQIGLQH